VKKRTQITEII